jgi:hypothetical protein
MEKKYLCLKYKEEIDIEKAPVRIRVITAITEHNVLSMHYAWKMRIAGE